MTASSAAPATSALSPYIGALSVHDLFVDHSYQRSLDLPRARRLAETWEPPLIGVIEASDRGPGHQPRYAIVDGQHRYAAAKLRDPNAVLVANIHTGLTERDEAHLFYEIDARRTRLTGWDRWNARRGAGDQAVLAVESVIEDAGLRVEDSPTNGSVRCVATCEKVFKLGGQQLLRETLGLITEVWGVEVEAFDAPLVHGTALVLWHYGKTLDVARLADAMVDVSPRQFKAKAIADARVRAREPAQARGPGHRQHLQQDQRAESSTAQRLYETRADVAAWTAGGSIMTAAREALAEVSAESCAAERPQAPADLRRALGTAE